MLAYGRALQQLVGDEEVVPGVGSPSLLGGDWEGDAKRRDLRDVFKTYCDESVSKEVRRFSGGFGFLGFLVFGGFWFLGGFVFWGVSGFWGVVGVPW